MNNNIPESEIIKMSNTGIYYDFLITGENGKILACKERNKETEIFYSELAIEKLVYLLSESANKVAELKRINEELLKEKERLKGLIEKAYDSGQLDYAWHGKTKFQEFKEENNIE